MESLTRVTAETARSIAREAYTYGFPLVESYETLYQQAIDSSSSDFKAPINQIGHATSVAIPDDTQFVTPNTDTPYSYLWADLRAEPIVITMPKIESGRYYTGQVGVTTLSIFGSTCPCRSPRDRLSHWVVRGRGGISNIGDRSGILLRPTGESSQDPDHPSG